MNAAHASSPLMTSTEVAGLLRIDERTLRRLRTNPACDFPRPAVLGRAVRWRRAQVRAWLENRP